MKKHYVTAICCVAMGLALLWGAAQAALPKLDELTLIPGLNELALKESIRARVGSILQDNGKDASKLTLDAISIDKAEAVDVRGIKLYAVKLSLQNPEQPDGQRDEMTLLTESSGTIQFGMVSEIATGLEAALSQATEITKMELPERLSSPLLIGTGSHDAETYTFFLKGKFAAKTQAAIAEFQKYRITGTPAIIIDGQLIRGFDRQVIDARLQAGSSDSQ